MKGKGSIIVAGALVAVVVGVLVAGFLQLRRRAAVADVISDEARWDYLDSLSAASRMKVVVLEDGMVARYVSEDENAYTCDIQDTFLVGKDEACVELWTAAEGKGFVYLKRPGSCPAYSSPDVAAEAVGELVYDLGYVPDTYPCLGLEMELGDGWYKIDMGGRVAYVEAWRVYWDAIDSF